MYSKHSALLILSVVSTYLHGMEKPSFKKVVIENLDTFDYKAASVLPMVDGYLVLGRESRGRSKGLYADFGGFKSRTEVETPIRTAARELCEETAECIGTESDLQAYIDPRNENTVHVIANIPLKHAMFVTKFDKEAIEKFIANFLARQHQITEKEKKEKDTIALVHYVEFINKIKSAIRDERGFLPDVTMQATTFDPNEYKENVAITVRAGLVAVVFPYLHDALRSNDKILCYEMNHKM